MRDDFAIFILTHGRARDQKTLDMLKGCGYSGKYYLIIDDLDDQGDDYKELYGDHVVVFDKMKIYEETDTASCEEYLKCILYARNFSEKFARELGLKYFMMLDDDIRALVFRYPEDGSQKTQHIESDIDELLEAFIEFAESGSIACVSFGTQVTYVKGIKVFDSLPRRCFQTFLRKVDIPIEWRSVMNEDYVTSFHDGKTGTLFLEVPKVQIYSVDVGENTNGMQETYERMNEYVRSFFAPMIVPSAFIVNIKPHKTVIQSRGVQFAAPCIISSRWKK